MNRSEFLTALEKSLSGLPRADIDERLSFYSEMLDDKLEEGLPEEKIIEDFGPVEEIAEQIIGDTPLVKIVKEKARPKRAMRAWEIILLIVGSPLWISILAALAAVLLSVSVVLLTILALMWVAVAVLYVCGIAGIAGAVGAIIYGNFALFFAFLGAGFVCAGIGTALIPLCILVGKGFVRLIKVSTRALKIMIVGKEDKK